MKKVYLLYWEYSIDFVKLIFSDGEILYMEAEYFDKFVSSIICLEKDIIKANFKCYKKLCFALI